MTHLTYLEAGVVGLVQGISEMFPVSSLGHNVLIPALIGGSWAKDLNVAAPESPYLAFIVGLHVATASRSGWPAWPSSTPSVSSSASPCSPPYSWPSTA